MEIVGRSLVGIHRGGGLVCRPGRLQQTVSRLSSADHDVRLTESLEGDSNILVRFCLPMHLDGLRRPSGIYQQESIRLLKPILRKRAAAVPLSQYSPLNPGRHRGLSSHDHEHFPAAVAAHEAFLLPSTQGHSHIYQILRAGVHWWARSW